jgi:hypothetical protein
VWSNLIEARRRTPGIATRCHQQDISISTVGRDEEIIRAHIKNQEIGDQELDQLQLKAASS